MSAIEVVVRPSPLPAGPEPGPITGLLDLIVDGINVTSRLGEGAAVALLAEVATGVAALSRGRRDRVTAPFYSGSEAWEVGLEADGAELLLSVYRTAPSVAVAVHERRLELVAFRAALVRALDLAEKKRARSSGGVVGAARAGLAGSWPSFGRRPLERRPVTLATPAGEPIAFSSELVLRLGRASSRPREGELERADLHSLLAHGSLRARAGRAELDFGPLFPFLAAERLLALADEALAAFRAGRPLQRRVELGGSELRLARGTGVARLRLSCLRAGSSPHDAGVTLADLDPCAFARAAARLALALEAAFVDTDPAQHENLRLGALGRAARRLEAELGALAIDDSVTNPEPDSYRGFGVPAPCHARGKWEHGGKMRFVPRWVAAVPKIDLAATFQCGERLIVGSETQTACLDRASGEVLWRSALPRAASVPTPLGLVRLGPSGEVALYDLERGQLRFSTYVAPRPLGGAAGALVNVEGLPRLLALAEGERAVVAIDLAAGEVSWRYRAPRAARFRLRRAGKLILVAGDSALVALDAASGEVVWRVRERLPFTGDVTVDRDSAFATAGGPLGPTLLVHVDLWRGDVRWRRELGARPALGQAPLVAGGAVVVPTRDRRGSGLSAFERSNGEPLWEHVPGLTAPATAWLAVDELVLGNSASGEVLAIHGTSSAVVHRHAFPRHVAADQPRRLEPVLRSGALFVPQEQVHVMRPRDGELLATLPSDLIPDLLRVDEECSVYLAEESGHVAAFGVAPRLTLVR